MILALLFAAALRGALIFGVAGVIAFALRRRAAATRHLVWTFAIAAQLALLVTPRVVPQWRVSVAPLDRLGARLQPAAPANPASAPVSSALQRIQAKTKETRPATSPFVLIWVAGAFLLAVRFLTGSLLILRDKRLANRPVKREWTVLTGAIQETMRLYRKVTLLWGTGRAVPYTCGAISPVICLPAEADTWSDDRLRVVLTHELAHVERYDAVTELVAQLALVVFWFSPFVWLATRQMRTEREHACDDRVLLGGVQPSTYVAELVELMKSIGKGSRAPAFAAIAMARRTQFEERMFAVLDERKPRNQITTRSVVMVAMIMMLLMLTVAAIEPVAIAGKPFLPAPKAVAAETWGQSSFDELVQDCQRPRKQRRVRVCDVRTLDETLLGGMTSFDGGYLDGIIVRTSSSARRSGRMLVTAEGFTDAEARQVAAAVHVAASAGRLHTEGPGSLPSNDWWVIYEVMLPAGSTLKARTELGQIGLRGFDGVADVAAINGPLQIIGASGDIRGRTESGPMFVGLDGSGWHGKGLDLESQNGAVYLSIPRNYSAHLIAGTTNGPLDLTYPILIRQLSGKRIDADVGSGGTTVRVITRNGPADIR